MTFAACRQLTEIRLPVFVDQDRDIIRLHAALISTISSPCFRKIKLAFNGASPTREAMAFSGEEWEALEDVLLELTWRSGNVIQLVISFEEGAELPYHHDEFLSRFLEVGVVRFKLGSSWNFFG